ncbi:hypothetical protein JTE90_012994 [Oedothorax gibbosus]|uniref:IRF tryptophan pentad repeat domain-containing protein n=1 Tax=Oedothorax gibbosus TaxID=931172 RepID=A0AAV6TT24_9ARAC|nr:hypothetical protein JTE90_012994 [Oedothorax gibbosus]
MGRKGSQLIPFLIDALEKKKYTNLKYEDLINRTFSLFLPQKSSKLEDSCQLILKGWFKVKRRRYILNIDYTKARQCLEAALRKSDFLELISTGRKQKRFYRFLDQDEILEKKHLKRKKQKKLKLDPYEGLGIALSPGSSGYDSGSDHAEEVYEGEENWNLVHGFNHDHKYIKNSEIVIVSYGSTHLENTISFGNANPSNRPEVLFHDSFNRIIKTPGNNSISNYPVEYIDIVTNQTIAIERQTDEKECNYMVPDQKPLSNNEAQASENSFATKESCYWDALIQSRRTFENPYGNLDLSKPPDNLFSEEEDDPQLQDPDKINFDLPLDNNTRLSDVELNDIFDFVMNSENHLKKEEISTPTTLTSLEISSHKTKWVKVYECHHVQNLPEMIMLTCEPKLKEFCITDETEINESRPQLIFDEATMQLISKCTIENLQLLSNDYLLVFFKVQRVY